MKKLLLGTSALVAAGLFSNGALAQTATTDQPIQLKLGGQYYAGIGAMIAQDDGVGQAAYKREPISVQDYFLIRFIGSTTFSNGITAGVWTRLNAFSAPNAAANTATGFQSSNNTTIKDSYVYLKNTAVWGEFRLGDDSDTRRAVATGNGAGVTGDGDIGANSPALAWINGPFSNATTRNLDGRGTKIEYYSPTMAGFQLGISYTPDAGGGHTFGPGNGGDSAGGPTDNNGASGTLQSYYNAQNYYNFVSASAQWSGTLGPVKTLATLGYTTASRKCSVSTSIKIAPGASAPAGACSISNSGSANPQVYNAGVQFDYGPWQLGTDFEQQMATGGGAGADQVITKTADMNLSYTIGAVRIGGEYSRGAYEGLSGVADVKKAGINNEFQLGASYMVGPGVQIAGILQQVDYDPDGATSATPNIFTKSYDSTALIFTTTLRF